MKSILLLLLGLFISISIFSQEKTQKYSQAKIFYSNTYDLQKLEESGVAVDHGKHKKNSYIESVFSEYEIQKAKELGFHVLIEIDDMEIYIANRKAEKKLKNSVCTQESKYTTPINFNLGSMGGFYTYAEMLQELDDMHALYPNLITAKTTISDYITYENRPIYSVKISDNPEVNETEPEILFTAVHHAREPASMQQLLFYMWYLLENYATDNEIKSIVDNTEQYFVPVVNPDGYIYNQITNPNGGGFWRKNRRNNGDGSFGVDNNRNYSYHWRESGVSNSGSGQTWPGTAAFSEPENQAIKWFCEQHEFIMALNNHTYSGLLLYPFGYAANTPTVEDSLFEGISGLMVTENNYINGAAASLYEAAGDSDDWMYGDTTTKNKIYAMTPEIGYSFWPEQGKIIPLCKSMMYHNITAAHLITNYAHLTDKTDSFLPALTGNIAYSIKRFGLQEPANFTVSILPVSDNIVSVGNVQSHNGMQLFQQENGTISYTLDNSIQNGDIVEYKLQLNNGQFTTEQTIVKTFGATQIVFADAANTLNNYNPTNWSTTNATYYSASSSITDSPFGNYSNNVNRTIELSNIIDLTNVIIAKATFYAKWDIERDYDYVQFEITTDGGVNWIPQCGKYTNLGVENQGIFGQPNYDGKKSEWVKEEIDLSDYLGEQIRFRFQLVSDGSTVKDGFYFDDFNVRTMSTNTASILKNEFLGISMYPNPTKEILTIHIPNRIQKIKIKMYAINGQLVRELKTVNEITQMDIRNLSKGVYFVDVQTADKVKTFKVIKK